MFLYLDTQEALKGWHAGDQVILPSKYMYVFIPTHYNEFPATRFFRTCDEFRDSKTLPSLQVSAAVFSAWIYFYLLARTI